MSIAIVAGALANKPQNGGFAWVPLSYAIGLRRLGFDVYIVEQAGAGADASFFFEVCSDFGWENRSFLLSAADDANVRQVAADAELLVNISGHATLDWVVSAPRLTAYIDTDPGFTQLWHRAGLLHPSIDGHDFHFSVGCNIGRPGCMVPDDGIQWRPSPPPVVLEHWPAVNPPVGAGMRFTTVAAWRSPSGVVSLDGEHFFPAKLHEFRRVLSLPSLLPATCFEIALDIHPGDAADRDRLLAGGWHLVDPRVVAGHPQSFRAYVLGSAAEFSTVQGVYSALRTGWISDRSVRYLASGRPALVQDTGVSREIANGDGLVTFSSVEEAREGAQRIAADYGAHAAAARYLAETYFDSDRVLGDMLDQMGVRR